MILPKAHGNRQRTGAVCQPTVTEQPVIPDPAAPQKHRRLPGAEAWVLVFFALGLAGILNHAMWRDELNVWLIVRDSPSPLTLLQHIKYEGHPALWYLCLYALVQFTHNPVAMQLFHLALATGSAYLFLRCSPFPAWQRVLFAFGYLPFYEYLLISRNYAFGLLFLGLFCAVYSRWPRHYLPLAGLLVLLANTNAYGLLFAFALGVALALEYRSDPGRATAGTRFWGAAALFGAGLAVSALTIAPPADSTLAGGASGWTLYFDANHFFTALSRIWSGYIAVLVPNDAHAWEMILFSIPALAMCAFACALIADRPMALTFYLLATGGVFLLTYTRFIGAPRHFGHFYVALIVALWLAECAPVRSLPPGTVLADGWKFARQHGAKFVGLLLVCQCAAGLVAYVRDWLVPYSASREAARFIRDHGLAHLPIVGSRDYAVSPLCGYLDRRIYYPESRHFQSFVLFNAGRNQEVSDAQILAQVNDLLRRTPAGVLLVLNHTLTAHPPGLKIDPVAEFTRSFIDEEIYHLYRVGK
jgi:hypothetical protein